MSLVAPRYLGTLNFDVQHIIVLSQVWFSAKDIGDTLEYSNPRKACRDTVKEKYRKRLGDLVDSQELDRNEKNTIYISEPGLWQWLGTSKQAKADQFQDWLYEIALPRLRKGLITQVQCAALRNEAELHYRVVAFFGASSLILL